jgi:hypothetical protein
MTTSMRNGRDRRLGKPVKCHARKERALLVGTRSANHIRASGHNGCTQRPDTWLHPNASQKTSDSPCTAGAVHTWHFSAVPTALSTVGFGGRPADICSMRVLRSLTRCGHGADRVGSGIPALWASSDWIDPISAHHQHLIGRDHTLEVVGFHAGDQANIFQCRKLLLRFGGLPERQIEFAQVFVGAAVAAIEQ